MTEAIDYTAMSGAELVATCRNDGVKWGAAFVQHLTKAGPDAANDVEWISGWFANAIMTSLDIEHGKEPQGVICSGCGRREELRFGFCWDCATAGEKRAAQRSVWQHLWQGIKNRWRGNHGNASIDFKWARERLTKTGDYAPGGSFEREHGIRPGGIGNG